MHGGATIIALTVLAAGPRALPDNHQGAATVCASIRVPGKSGGEPIPCTGHRIRRRSQACAGVWPRRGRRPGWARCQPVRALLQVTHALLGKESAGARPFRLA